MTLLIRSSTSQSAAAKGTQGQMATHHFPLWRWGQGWGRDGKGEVSPLQPVSQLEAQWVHCESMQGSCDHDIWYTHQLYCTGDYMFGRIGSKTDGPICPVDLVNTFRVAFWSECSSSLSWGERKQRDGWMFGGYKGRQKAGERAWE